MDYSIHKSPSFREGFFTISLKQPLTINKYLDIDSPYTGRILEEFLYGVSSAIVKPYLENKIKKVEESTSTKQTSNIKLKWNGNKNQLYDVLRQLKGKTNSKGDSLLANSYEELAVFLKSNVLGFTETELSTIVKEIGKNKRPPKNRRQDLDITE